MAKRVKPVKIPENRKKAFLKFKKQVQSVDSFKHLAQNDTVGLMGIVSSLKDMKLPVRPIFTIIDLLVTRGVLKLTKTK